MKLTTQQVESLKRLAYSEDFKVVFGALTDLHAKVVNALIASPPDELVTRQGHAQIVDEILDDFSKAMKG